MEGRRLIASAKYGPDTLTVLFKAFDAVWDHLAPKFGTDRLAIEAARLRLANIILSVAEDDSNDAEQLKTKALRIIALDERTWA